MCAHVHVCTAKDRHIHMSGRIPSNDIINTRRKNPFNVLPEKFQSTKVRILMCVSRVFLCQWFYSVVVVVVHSYIVCLHGEMVALSYIVQYLL